MIGNQYCEKEEFLKCFKSGNNSVREKDQGQRGSQFSKERNKKTNEEEENMEEWNLCQEEREQ